MKIRMGMGTQISGSLAGVTAGHNKGGQYLRNRSIPTNPNTARQQSVRAGFGAAVQSWSDSLSENDRQSWRDYAQQVDVTDAFGDPKQLSGQQWYVGMATLVAQVSDTELVVANLPDFDNAAPGIANTGAPITAVDVATVDFTTPPGSVNLSFELQDPASANGVALFFIGAPVTPGTRFYKGPYQLAAAENVAEDDPSVVFAGLGLGEPADWASTTIPTPANVDAFFPFRLRILYNDGRLSQELRELVQFEDVTP